MDSHPRPRSSLHIVVDVTSSGLSERLHHARQVVLAKAASCEPGMLAMTAFGTTSTRNLLSEEDMSGYEGVHTLRSLGPCCTDALDGLDDLTTSESVEYDVFSALVVAVHEFDCRDEERGQHGLPLVRGAERELEAGSREGAVAVLDPRLVRRQRLHQAVLRERLARIGVDGARPACREQQSQSATSAGPHKRTAASLWALSDPVARPGLVSQPRAWRASPRRPRQLGPRPEAARARAHAAWTDSTSRGRRKEAPGCPRDC